MSSQKRMQSHAANERARAILSRRALLKAAGAMGLLGASGLRGAKLFAAPTAEPLNIEAAIPKEAFARPARARRLLIFDLNVDYPGHKSIATANEAIPLMGKRTGAFEAVVSRDPAVFSRDSLRRFDAVFFNNTFGMIFDDPELKQSFVDFIYGGGGFLGNHATTFTFIHNWSEDRWPEFGVMLGARGGSHRTSDEHVFIKLDDPDHPVTRPFGGKGFEYRDEFFRVHAPYSRDRVRVLLSIDTAKTDMNQGKPLGEDAVRADGDYALAWLRGYGRGRTMYCTIGHNPYVFADPLMLQFYLAALQFVLGDLAGPTTPSNRLTPAVRAQEKLGWRLAMDAPRSGDATLFQSIDQAVQSELMYVCASSQQKTSNEIAKPFGPSLTDDERRQVRLKLDAAGVRLLAYSIPKAPGSESDLRALLDFSREMGIEVLDMPPAASSDRLEQFCKEYNIQLAARITDPEQTTASGNRAIVAAIADRPEALLKQLHGRQIKPAMLAIDPAHPMPARISAVNDLSVQLADALRIAGPN